MDIERLINQLKNMVSDLEKENEFLKETAKKYMKYTTEARKNLKDFEENNAKIKDDRNDLNKKIVSLEHKIKQKDKKIEEIYNQLQDQCKETNKERKKVVDLCVQINNFNKGGVEKPGHFYITVNDGFCTWGYDVLFSERYRLSIAKIMDTIVRIYDGEVKAINERVNKHE